MPTIAELILQIKDLFDKKREQVFGILIVLLLCSVIVILYQYMEADKLSHDSVTSELKKMHDAEIMALRNDFIKSQIEFNDQIRLCSSNCRNKIDSIENYYFTKFILLRDKYKQLSIKLENIE